MSLKMSIHALALLLALAPCAPAQASQNELVPPTSGIFTGVQFSQKIGDAFRSLAGCNKGPTAPANVGGSAVDGLCWIDDSGSPWIVKKFVNGAWAVTGALDPTDSSYAGVIGGGLGSISSGSTVDLGSVPQANVTITGTTGISLFGASAPAGISKIIRFDNALVITPSNSLTVPGGFPLTTALGDRAIATHLGSGNWEITQYTRANGIPIDVSAVGKLEFSSAIAVPPLHVAAYGQALTRATYPAYFAMTTRAQNGTRISGNATITGIADTSGFGAGMPVESTGVGAGCTIASLVANTSITLNSSSCVTSSGTSTVTVFPYGYGAGGSTSTVGVQDCRTNVLAGRDRNDPGSFAGKLTATYFGSNPAIFNTANGGESKTLLTSNLPPYTPSGTMAPAISVSQFAVASQSGGTAMASNAGANVGSSNAFIADTFTGIAQGGVSTPFRTVQPTLMAECFVRVIP